MIRSNKCVCWFLALWMIGWRALCADQVSATCFGSNVDNGASVGLSDASTNNLITTRVTFTNHLGALTNCLVRLHVSAAERSGELWSYYPQLTIFEPGLKGRLFELYSTKALQDLQFIHAVSGISCYLTFQDDGRICMIKMPSLFSEADNQNSFGWSAPCWWHADNIIDLSEYDDWENEFLFKANRCELAVEEISDTGGTITVAVTNAFGKRFTFTKAQNGWALSDLDGEIRRIKTNSLDFGFLVPDPPRIRGSFWVTLRSTDKTDRSVRASFLQRNYRTQPGRENLSLFQLVEATNYAVVLSPSVWTTLKGGGPDADCFSVVKRDSTGGYWLTFVDCQWQIYLTALPAVLPDCGYIPDQTVGPFATPRDNPFVRGAVDCVIPLWQIDSWERWDKFFAPGGAVEAVTLKGGVFTISVTNGSGDRIKISNSDGRWHAYNFWGEIKRKN